MPDRCCVPLCTSGYTSNPEKVSMFKIPKDKLAESKINNNMCNSCSKSKRAITLFIKKGQNSISILSRKEYLRKRSDRRRKQLQRLKLKNKRIIQQIKTARQKIQNMEKEDLFKKIEELNNLGSSQKILLGECINACRYKKKSSKRYSSGWLLICLLMHIKSPAGYRFLRNNDILPLPAISTIKHYLSRVNFKCGLDENFFEAFKLKMYQKNIFQRHGILIFDEMQVREDINLNVLKPLKPFSRKAKLTDNSIWKKLN